MDPEKMDEYFAQQKAAHPEMSDNNIWHIIMQMPEAKPAAQPTPNPSDPMNAGVATTLVNPNDDIVTRALKSMFSLPKQGK